MWVEDLKFYVSRALRAVGVGLMVAMWLSVLTAHVQLPAETRDYLGMGLSTLSVAVVQLLGGAPPSLE